MDEQLVRNMTKIKNNLDNIKVQLNYLNNLLDESININNTTFKENDIDEMKKKVNIQLNNLNTKIIPKLKGI